MPAYFGDCPGDINTHILLRMKKVLAEDISYPYLMKNAVKRLSQARSSALSSGITEQPLICLGGNMWCLFPWLGTYSFFAMERFLKIKCSARLGLRGMDSARPYYIQFVMKVSPADFFRILAEEADLLTEPLDLVYPNEVPVFEKYDEYLPNELVRKGFAYGILNIDEMKQRVKEWAEQFQ